MFPSHDLYGVQVVSANTDGLVSYYPDHAHSMVREIIGAWEAHTGFVTEETAYSALYSRDVNNYIAVGTDGSAKTKGAYTPSVGNLHKNPTANIISKALIAFLKDGVPFETTINESEDIRDFVYVRKVTGGAFYENGSLGKVARWYIAKRAISAILTSSGKQVSDSNGCRPVMKYADGFKCPDDLNRHAYIEVANKALFDLGVKRRSRTKDRW